MIKNILVLCFFCVILSGTAFCQDDIEIDSQIMSVNPDKEYIIIKVGEKDGVEIGDGLIIHRDAEKLAEAQVVEVRDNVAAAEILNVEKEQKKEVVEQVIEKNKEIKEGDDILIVKKARKYRATKESRAYQEPKKSKWKTILGSSSQAMSTVPVENVTSAGYANSGYGYTTETASDALNPEKITVSQESSIVRAEISTDSSAVFSYALMVLRENGYSVIFSNRATGNILATMPIDLTLMKELWADSTGSIEHKIVTSLEIKNKDGGAELNVASFKEHIQKGKQVKFPIVKDSKYYGLLVELASKIKERAER